jgi:phosphatidylethanolamine-binding protein (PEBP) family uncharacterized protein
MFSFSVVIYDADMVGADLQSANVGYIKNYNGVDPPNTEQSHKPSFAFYALKE